MANNDYAVVVGINHYPNPPLADLRGPENDALAFRDWLVSPMGGAVPDDNDHIHLILSHNFPGETSPLQAKPTTEEVDRAFEEIIENLRDNRPGRRLYMFFAGHGISPQTALDDAALLMANAGEYRMGHNIPGKAYVDWFRGAALFREIVLFMDCCRDNWPQARLHHPPWDVDQQVSAADVRTFSGLATKWNRVSREKEVENRGEVRGLFSYAVLTVLRSGRLNGAQLKNCVINYLKLLVPAGQSQEAAVYLDPIDDINFSEAAPPARLHVTITFRLQMHGNQVELLDGQLNSCGVREASAEPWELDLELGHYLIQDQVTHDRKTFPVLGGPVNVEF